MHTWEYPLCSKLPDESSRKSTSILHVGFPVVVGLCVDDDGHSGPVRPITHPPPCLVVGGFVQPDEDCLVEPDEELRAVVDVPLVVDIIVVDENEIDGS